MRARWLLVVLTVLAGACTPPAASPEGDAVHATPTAAAQEETTPTAAAEGAGPADDPEAPATPSDDHAEAAAADPEVVLRDPDGGEVRRFTVEIVATPRERQQGLMGRTELPDDAGMLFVFPRDTDGGFWMKNTLIPLTIAYARADGTVVTVLDMEPCAEDPCPVYEPGGPYRYALEVNQGALAAAGPGWRLELPRDLPPAS